MAHLLVQAESQGLSGFHACKRTDVRRFRVRAGEYSSRSRALRSRAAGPAGQSAPSAPLRFTGRYGAAPR